MAMLSTHPGYLLEQGNLTDLIINAWLSALRIKGDQYRGLVYFPKHSCYRLNRKILGSTPEFNKLMQRVEYMAKHRSKLYGQDLAPWDALCVTKQN